MIRIALDSNILLYAELEPDSDKGALAADTIAAAALRGILAAQVLGEFLNVVRRQPKRLTEAQVQAALYRLQGKVFDKARKAMELIDVPLFFERALG